MLRSNPSADLVQVVEKTAYTTFYRLACTSWKGCFLCLEIKNRLNYRLPALASCKRRRKKLDILVSPYLTIKSFKILTSCAFNLTVTLVSRLSLGKSNRSCNTTNSSIFCYNNVITLL